VSKTKLVHLHLTEEDVVEKKKTGMTWDGVAMHGVKAALSGVMCTPGDHDYLVSQIELHNACAADTGVPTQTQESFMREVVGFWKKGHCPECEGELQFMNHVCGSAQIKGEF